MIVEACASTHPAASHCSAERMEHAYRCITLPALPIEAAEQISGLLLVSGSIVCLLPPNPPCSTSFTR